MTCYIRWDVSHSLPGYTDDFWYKNCYFEMTVKHTNISYNLWYLMLICLKFAKKTSGSS